MEHEHRPGYPCPVGGYVRPRAFWLDLKNITITGFQVRPEYLTAVCGTCGALLGDIDQHDRWHADHTNGSPS